MSGFSRDDRHFVFFPGGGATALPHIIDLVTGTETTSTSTQIPLQLAVTFSLDAVVNDWAVFRANWNSYGQLLWAVDWQGTVTRFGADMPMYVDEYAQQFDSDRHARRLVSPEQWIRWPTGRLPRRLGY